MSETKQKQTVHLLHSGCSVLQNTPASSVADPDLELGVGGGGGEGDLDLLTLLAFFPSVISYFFTHNRGGGGGGGPGPLPKSATAANPHNSLPLSIEMSRETMKG